MRKIWGILKKHWVASLTNLTTSIIAILIIIEPNLNNEVSIALKLSLMLSLTLSIAINIKIAVKFQKNITSLNNQIQYNNQVIQSYEIQLKSTTVYNFDSIDSELPTLAISHVPYTILPIFFPGPHDDDAIQYVDDSIEEKGGSTYYCYIKDRDVLFSLNKEKIIKDYYHNTMAWIKLQNGDGLTSKPRHLIVFKLINVSEKPVLSMIPQVRIDAVINKYKGVAPNVLKPNDEILFVVLVELCGIKENQYTMEFLFQYKGKQYIQEFPIKLVGDELSYEVLLKEPKEYPPVIN